MRDFVRGFVRGVATRGVAARGIAARGIVARGIVARGVDKGVDKGVDRGFVRGVAARGRGIAARGIVTRGIVARGVDSGVDSGVAARGVVARSVGRGVGHASDYSAGEGERWAICESRESPYMPISSCSPCTIACGSRQESLDKRRPSYVHSIESTMLLHLIRRVY